RPEEVPASEARVREAEAQVLDHEAQLKHGEELFAKKIIGDAQLTHRRQALQAAREQLARARAEHQLLQAGAWTWDRAIARAQLAQAQAQLELTRTEWERLTVRSPVAGTVLQVNVRRSAFTGPPHGPAPVVLGNLKQLQVRVDIDAADIPRFRPQAPARGMIRGAAQRPVSLTFLRVVPLVVPKRSLTGDMTERVDTRVMQVIYRLD